jgi:hypothetical protein
MPFAIGVTVTLAPGESYVHPFALSPTQRVLIRPAPLIGLGGTTLAYADAVVYLDVPPIGFLPGRVRSVRIDEVGAYFGSVPESASFGGWYVRIYAVNRPNGFPIALSLITE